MNDEFWESIANDTEPVISLQKEREKTWEAQKVYRAESRKKSAQRKKEKQKKLEERKKREELLLKEQEEADLVQSGSKAGGTSLSVKKGRWKTVKFGRYPQRKNLLTGKYMEEEVTWNILGQTEHEVLLISRRILDARPFDGDFHGCDWEYSDLRMWLNEEFIHKIFSEEERQKLRYSRITTGDGVETIDRVFLPSSKEMMCKEYGFPDHDQSSKERIAKCTDYAKKQGCLRYNHRSPYWLRNSGSTTQTAMNVGTSGYVYHLMEENVTSHSMGIRPMIRISQP